MLKLALAGLVGAMAYGALTVAAQLLKLAWLRLPVRLGATVVVMVGAIAVLLF